MFVYEVGLITGESWRRANHKTAGADSTSPAIYGSLATAPISARALIAFAVLERIKGLRLPVRPVKPTCD